MAIVSDDRVAVFLAKALGKNVVPPYVVVGTEKDGEIINGVLINHYTGHDCHVSIAGRGWSKEIIRGVGEYVFDKLLCLRITVVTEQPRVVSIAERMGGKVEGLMRNHFGDGKDAYIVGILQEDWKF